MEYQYSIISNFKNRAVNSTALELQIRGSTIKIALDYINTVGDICSVNFKSTLDDKDKTILDSIIVNHDGVESADEDNPFLRNLGWDEFKQYFLTNEEYINYIQTSEYYEVWIQLEGVKIYCIINKTNTVDIIDFETNYKIKCNGHKVISNSLSNFKGFLFYRESFKNSIKAGETKRISVKFGEAVLFFGGDYFVIGERGENDSIEFMITDEDNILGRGNQFILRKFIKTEFIVSEISNFAHEIIKQQNSGVILDSSYFYFTCVYTSTGTQDLSLVTRYEAWTK